MSMINYYAIYEYVLEFFSFDSSKTTYTNLRGAIGWLNNYVVK